MTDSTHPNITLLRTGLDLVAAGRSDDVVPLLTDDFRITVHGAPETLVGREAWLGNVAIMNASFSDLTLDIRHELADGDLVAFNITYTARHTGDFLGIPATGRTVSWQSLEHYRVRDGLITEEWIASDISTLLGQLAPHTAVVEDAR
ncbi:ester cyclase [Microbacterium sp. ET2]|uniref:ester cyclase n=1 Tax=Microbacterium albipurpureum TaxID=3050384 RepID=UPI00259CD80B|nr:ester cyclase [Microbacterium sp. ET2 (Ac-2212)]WJL94683.1 ester cyclase [Microbacterium sp. ET2 (Ac-2212)]